MIGILTNGPRVWPSSRFRGFWLQDSDPMHFMVYGPDDPLGGIEDCDTVIFQKRQRPEDIQRAYRYKSEGKTVIYDLCDPIWWWKPDEVTEMFKVADCVTVSSEGLFRAVRNIPLVKECWVIPDRMLASYHPTIAKHEKRDKTVLVWFGSTGNRISLMGAMPILGYIAHNRPIELRIIDGAPHLRNDESEYPALTTTNIAWTLETFHAQLTDCDIAILPPYPGPWGDMKSNNKEVTAAWAGLPYTDGYDLNTLVEWIDHPEMRQEIAAKNRARVEAEYEISRTCAQFKELAASLKNGVTTAYPNGNHKEGDGSFVTDKPFIPLLAEDHHGRENVTVTKLDKPVEIVQLFPTRWYEGT